MVEVGAYLASLRATLGIAFCQWVTTLIIGWTSCCCCVSLLDPAAGARLRAAFCSGPRERRGWAQ
jgi:hypothetical protein